MPFRHETIFYDPAPDAFILNRYVRRMLEISVQHTDLAEDERLQFVNLLVLIAKKLVSVRSHWTKHCEIEDALIEIAKSGPPIETLEYQEIGYSQDLFIEMDEFLVQVKSTLDYAVKLPRTIIGPTFPWLHTFGDKGGALIKALRSNLPRKLKSQGEMIEKWIVEETKCRGCGVRSGRSIDSRH